MMRCLCEFSIIDDAFSCRGSQGEFRNTVVYRAMITLQVPTSPTGADNIVTEINKWVQTMPSLLVNGIILDLDPDCPAMLESFASNDCDAETILPSNQSTSSPLSTGIIIGVAVTAIVIILLLIIVIVVIIVYFRRKSSRHKSSYRYYLKLLQCCYIYFSYMYLV